MESTSTISSSAPPITSPRTTASSTIDEPETAGDPDAEAIRMGIATELESPTDCIDRYLDSYSPETLRASGFTREGWTNVDLDFLREADPIFDSALLMLANCTDFLRLAIEENLIGGTEADYDCIENETKNDPDFIALHLLGVTEGSDEELPTEGPYFERLTRGLAARQVAFDNCRPSA